MSLATVTAVAIAAQPAHPAPSTADVVALTVDGRHSCALHADGAVSCWGANDHGQLGDGTTNRSAVPVRVVGVDDAIGIAASGDRTCARRRDDTAVCWGELASHQETTRPTAMSPTGVVQISGSCMRTARDTTCLDQNSHPVAVPGVTDAIDVAANGKIGCVAHATGAVSCWFSPSDVRPIAGVHGAVQVAVAGEFACARTSDGAVTCWDWSIPEPGEHRVGTPPSGQLPVKPARVAGVVARSIVGGGDQLCAITAIGVHCWWPEPLLTRPWINRIGKVTALAIGYRGGHSCAARSHRDVICWGEGLDGQLGNGWTKERSAPTKVAGITDAVEIAVSFPDSDGSMWSCARRRGGTVTCWGESVTCWGTTPPDDSCGGHAAPRPFAKLSHVTRLVRGSHVGWIDDRHRRWSAEYAGSRMYELPPVIDADGDCALGKDGRVLCSDEHEPADISRREVDGTAIAGITDAVHIAVTHHRACLRRRSGQVACFAARGPVIDVAEVPDAIDLSAGKDAVCAVRADHTVWCWGLSATWLLRGVAAGTQGERKPTQIAGLADVAAISLGVDHACARKTDGTLWCWGDNQLGQLGDGTTTSRAQPVKVPLAGVAQVAAGHEHTCALLHDGTVACWGNASDGSVGSYILVDSDQTTVTW
jgi:alpha-tubulin suppressor-like RCC1 family protein